MAADDSSATTEEVDESSWRPCRGDGIRLRRPVCPEASARRAQQILRPSTGCF